MYERQRSGLLYNVSIVGIETLNVFGSLLINLT